MKAVVFTEYGLPEVLQLRDIDKPTPKNNEVLVKVHATSLNVGDVMVRNFNKYTPRTFTMPAIFWLPSLFIFGIRKPKINILGNEFSGTIEALGQDVNQFVVGDEVFGYLGQEMGANAEYICITADGLITSKPKNLTFEQATTIPYGTLTAFSLLRKANIQPGQKVLINGASGSIGSAALQLAKHYGAEVTGTCGTQRIEKVKAIGADKVIDYTKTDFTQGDECYDLIVDIMNKSSFAKCKRVLNPNGIYLLASFKMTQIFQMLWTSFTGDKKVICALSGETPADLVAIKELVERGVIKAYVDRCFPLEQTADAHRYYESGQKKGDVVITIAT